jgi:DNA polymerase
VIVCLGATAAQALMGKQFRVTHQRGELLPFPLAGAIMATVHPSSILRAPDAESRKEATAAFIADLGRVALWLRQHRDVA